MENSRRQEKPAAAPLPEPPQAPAPEEAEQPPVHTDYKSQFDALIADTQEAPAEEAPPVSNVIPMELPHQMPPLVIDHFDAPKPAPAAQPLPPVEIPEQPEKLKKADVQLEAAQIAQEIGQQEPQKPEYEFPPVSLLKAGSGQSHDGTEEMRQNAERRATRSNPSASRRISSMLRAARRSRGTSWSCSAA